MATVNKNFRIKNGLVVEGSTATVNGQNILTETGSDQYILNLIGGETLVKSVSSDFAVDSSGNLTINGSSDLARTGDITSAINALDTDAIEEGTTNKYFTEQRTVDGVLGNSGGSVLSSYLTNSVQFGTPFVDVNISALESKLDTDGYAKQSDISTAIGNIDLVFNTDEISEGVNNLYFTDNRAVNAIVGVNGIVGSGLQYVSGQLSVDRSTVDGWYDASGAASSAEGAANTYTDNAINALDTDAVPESGSPTNKYFTDARARYAINSVIGSNSGLIVGSNDDLQVDTSVIATQTYVNNAIDNLIDGAPGLLDTLNEIAAAINDDANYFTTVANAINAKQDALTAGSNIDISPNAGQLVISVTGLDTDDVAEGSNLYFTDARARDAVDGTDRSFTSVAINEVAKQVAATTGNIVTAAATTALSWAKADYRSGKFTVKVKNGSHTEISEILVTLDTSDNVAITEYGIVGTNGSLGTVSADVSGSDVRIRVTPANNNSEVMVVGTLLI